MVSIISTGSPSIGPVEPQFRRIIEEIRDGTRPSFPISPSDVRATQVLDGANAVAEITSPDDSAEQRPPVITDDQPFSSTTFTTQLISQTIDTIEAISNAGQEVENSVQGQNIDSQSVQVSQEASIGQNPINAAFEQLRGIGFWPIEASWPEPYQRSF